MFKNPFKKDKDDGFSLDDYSLPSVSSQDSSNQVPENSVSSLPEGNLTNSLSDNSNLVDSSLTSPTPAFAQSPLPSSFESKMPEGDLNNNHNDLVKVKIESLDSKVTLLDARISSMEQKLNLIYEMIASEVSEDTKRKLKVKSMMNNIKE